MSSTKPPFNLFTQAIFLILFTASSFYATFLLVEKALKFLQTQIDGGLLYEAQMKISFWCNEVFAHGVDEEDAVAYKLSLI